LKPLFDVARVHADPAILAELTQEHQELALAATDLEDVFSTQVVTCDQVLREITREGPEAR
jgi:hypothetical protein